MRIFKFGGASVKDVAGVRNVVDVLQKEGYKDTLVVVSAMGKMTNAFEGVVKSFCEGKSEMETQLKEIELFHADIIKGLFHDQTHEIYAELEGVFTELRTLLNTQTNKNYDYVYDQIVGFGELLSTKIVSSCLSFYGIENSWIDVRDYIITDSNFRDARVSWESSRARINDLDTNRLYITQGFLGADSKGNTTTLGREGSDYTAAIFAHALEATAVTIWKDVAGVMNADPRYFESPQLLEKIPYHEAIEMAFYGASVMHPKTLKPLENKQIPLIVRSFYDLEKTGTKVGRGNTIIPEIPCYILKQDQILVSISALDFSFMVEHNIRDIFDQLHQSKLKVNLIQNSALSFSVCVEDKYRNFESFLMNLKENYKVSYSKKVSLYTIRHASEKAVSTMEQHGEVLLKQVTQGTVQLVIQK